VPLFPPDRGKRRPQPFDKPLLESVRAARNRPLSPFLRPRVDDCPGRKSHGFGSSIVPLPPSAAPLHKGAADFCKKTDDRRTVLPARRCAGPFFPHPRLAPLPSRTAGCAGRVIRIQPTFCMFCPFYLNSRKLAKMAIIEVPILSNAIDKPSKNAYLCR
jgi:hypothetical protein